MKWVYCFGMGFFRVCSDSYVFCVSEVNCMSFLYVRLFFIFGDDLYVCFLIEEVFVVIFIGGNIVSRVLVDNLRM